MDLPVFIQLHHLQHYIYFVMFLAMLADATFTVLAVMLLVSLGAVSLAPSLLVLLLGVFGEQLMFYGIGRKFNRWPQLAAWVNKVAHPFDRHFYSRPFHTLFLSKFIYGLHRTTLMRAGMLRIPFLNFCRYAFYCSVAWLIVVAGIGYAFSASYEILKKYFHYAELVPLVLVIAFFLAEWRFSKHLKKDL